MTIGSERIIEMIKDVGSLVPVETLDFSKDLTEQGFDSLDMMNVYLEMEERFGVKPPDEHLPHLHSVDAITAYVNEHAADMSS